MKISVEWERPLPLRDGSKQNLIYTVEYTRIAESPSVYVFGRNGGGSACLLGEGKRVAHQMTMWSNRGTPRNSAKVLVSHDIRTKAQFYSDYLVSFLISTLLHFGSAHS